MLVKSWYCIEAGNKIRCHRDLLKVVSGEDCSCTDIVELSCPCTVGGLYESNRGDGSDAMVLSPVREVTYSTTAQ